MFPGVGIPVRAPRPARSWVRAGCCPAGPLGAAGPGTLGSPRAGPRVPGGWSAAWECLVLITALAVILLWLAASPTLPA